MSVCRLDNSWQQFCIFNLSFNKTLPSFRAKHSFIHLFIHSTIHLFVHPFIRSSIHPFVHLFVHSFIHSFVYSISFYFYSSSRIGFVFLATFLFIIYNSYVINISFSIPRAPFSFIYCIYSIFSNSSVARFLVAFVCVRILIAVVIKF